MLWEHQLDIASVKFSIIGTDNVKEFLNLPQGSFCDRYCSTILYGLLGMPFGGTIIIFIIRQPGLIRLKQNVPGLKCPESNCQLLMSRNLPPMMYIPLSGTIHILFYSAYTRHIHTTIKCSSKKKLLEKSV
jgi:hypothetical protein